MIAKHTSGPWMVPHFARDDHPCECQYILADGFMGSVATVRNERDGKHYPAGDEAKANAYLIAAAPDLYEVLAAMIGKLGPDGYYPVAGKPLTDRARAVLAAARGEPA